MTNTSADVKSDLIVLYGIKDRSPLGETVPPEIQYILAMFLGNVVPSLTLVDAAGSASGQTTFLVQMALIVVGAVTLMQAFPIGPVGARLPTIMGMSFVFLGPFIGIGQQFGIAAVFGTSLPATPVELVMGVTFDRSQKYFPPLVTGIVVMFIGPTLIPTGVNHAADASAGPSTVSYGSFANPGLAGLVLVVMVILNQSFDGFLHVISAFVGIVVGYVVAIAFGMVSFTAVATAGWITMPTPLRFGLEFPSSAVLTVALLYVIIGLETIGDVSGTMLATGRNPARKEFRGGLVVDAVTSALAALLNALSNTSFSQNVGPVSFTGVASRHVVGIGGVVLVVLGLVPKVGTVVSVMPDAVLGGGALILFAMIFSSGARIITRNVTLDHRNSTILALSMAFGPGMTSHPEVLQNFPVEAQTLFGSALVTGGFTALMPNVVSPGDGVGLGLTEHTGGLDLENLTELSSSESSPSAPVDD